MQEVASQQNWPIGSWAYDGRKNIYAPSRFLPQRSQYEVSPPLLPHTCFSRIIGLP